eukprot:CAMPEP_0181192838 /NCGR_PEP_ID=MMETSP1096-20121128/13496_1 /TAXON_ID=156174 ORGANISM="Chrysochromulina ericina, Strain CCMP281" /NCGR_SAMPLE_ID=MMETSP1096 /ASSEMBLY_ACC=CAM_ASM_000453 /LENGTH=76 /DNA_ID=CAMNT_0023282259 /DNA_START=490 /DNA_END=717 /DNA_ORIENTATION=+
MANAAGQPAANSRCRHSHQCWLHTPRRLSTFRPSSPHTHIRTRSPRQQPSHSSDAPHARTMHAQAAPTPAKPPTPP